MEWVHFPEYDLLYTDPPWGERMAKSFATMQYKATGVRPEIDFVAIMYKLASYADCLKPMVIEFAAKDWETVVEIMENHNHVLTGVHPRIQSMGRTFVLLTFNAEITFGETTKGFDLIGEAIRQTGAKTVFDPFAGIGQTAKAAIKAGAEYIGSEINPARYERLVKVIS